ncbi:MAG: tetratricopeptide repeat protein [Pseudomonadota bacterium]
MTRRAKNRLLAISIAALFAGGAGLWAATHADRNTESVRYPPNDPEIIRAVRKARFLQKSGQLKDAVIELERLVTRGDPTAMYYLAMAYEKGWGVSADLEEMRALLLAAVEYEFGLRGQTAYKLGRLYQLAHDADCQKIAVAWFEKALQWDYPKAHMQLASHYERGIGIKQDLDLAIHHYEKAADAGFETASLSFARALVKGRFKERYDASRALALANRAVLAYEIKASNGSGTAAKVLGRLYRDGEFIEQSDEQALYWFRRSSLLGDTGGMHELGLFLIAVSTTVETDARWNEGLSWLKKAASLNHGGAMTALGRLHLKEERYLKKSDAPQWFERGVATGHGGSMEELARLKAAGELVPHDLPGAFALAERGAGLGHSGSRKLLKKLQAVEESKPLSLLKKS